MKQKVERVSKSIFIDPVLWEEFKDTTHDRRVSMSEVMEQLIREWLQKPAVEEVPPHLRRLVDVLKRRFTSREKVSMLVDAIEKGVISGE